MAKEKEEKMLNIYQRMNAVQKEVDYIQKGEKKVDNKYGFVSHDQVTAKMQPYLVKHGICVICSVDEYKNVNIETKRLNYKTNAYEDVLNLRTELVLNVKFVNIDDPKDFIEVKTIGFGLDPSDKGAGKAVSYAFKYALLKNFMLETGDDPDEDQTTYMVKSKQEEEEKKRTPMKAERLESKKEHKDLPRMSEEQAQELYILADMCSPGFMENLRDFMMKEFEAKSFEMCPANQYQRFKRGMENDINPPAEKVS
jgi:hypothetical protein